MRSFNMRQNESQTGEWNRKCPGVKFTLEAGTELSEVGALAWGWVRRARLQIQQVQMSCGENYHGEGEAGQWTGQQKGVTAGLDPRGLCSQWKGDCQVEWGGGKRMQDVLQVPAWETT